MAVRVTVLYDNTTTTERAPSDWGFAALVEHSAGRILFDTGADGQLLCAAAEELGVDLRGIDEIVISHDHWDHTGGLQEALARTGPVTVHLPASSSSELIATAQQAGGAVSQSASQVEIQPGVYLTGELAGTPPEQSLVVATAGGSVVVTGCAHPGIVEIIQRAQEIVPGTVALAVGGFHLFRTRPETIDKVVGLLLDLEIERVAPTHCTGEPAIRRFENAFGNRFRPAGVGQVLAVPSQQ